MQFNKRCSKCGETKVLDLFNQNSKSKDGRTSHCKVCKSRARADNADAIKQKKKVWYEANKDVVAEKSKADRKENPEKHRAKEAAKYEKNKDKIKARVLEYQKRNPCVYRKAGQSYRARNPHLNCAKAAKRRAVKLRATPKWADDEWEQFFIAEVYHLSQLRSNLGVEHHVDHIVPLVSDKVCGLHCAANLRVLPARQNESKGNKYWPDMWH